MIVTDVSKAIYKSLGLTTSSKQMKGPFITHNYFTATAKQHDIEAVYRQKEILYPNIYEDENKTHTLVEATKPHPITGIF